MFAADLMDRALAVWVVIAAAAVLYGCLSLAGSLLHAWSLRRRALSWRQPELHLGPGHEPETWGDE
jgi:hypothetical protein